MKRTRSDVDLPTQWARLPAFRRHVYFYVLLLLTTLSISAVNDLVKMAGASKKKGRKFHPMTQALASRTY